MPDFRYVLIQPNTRNGFVMTAPDYPMAVIVSREVRKGRLLKKTHMLRCARPISRQRTRRVRLRSSTFARLASEIFLSSLE